MKHIVLFSVALLSLTSCFMDTPTQSMPNGYYYQNANKYSVSNPPPTRPWIIKERRDKVDISNRAGVALTTQARQSYNP
jgi:hypothetical protein